MIELNGIQISDNNINTKKNVKIYTDEKQLSNVVDKEVHALKGALKDLHTPIAISTENTTESKAQNVRNIADFVAKAKAAGIADVNGLAVTFLIDDSYSVVGYLSGDNSICGIETYTGLEAPSYSVVDPDGTYSYGSVLVNGLSDQITSSMLTQGARKPIILTPETTEVDEETYQKLMSDDVDVVFKTDDGNLCKLTFANFGINDTVNFTCLSIEGNTMADFFIYGYSVAIDKNSPHICHITEDINNDFDSFLNEAGYLNKSILSPVLQEIDLTESDEERKANLDQFEADWKALTGASDMKGARFVGKVENSTGEGGCSVLFTFDYVTNALYYGCTMVSDTDKKIVSYRLNKNDGSLSITPLFSHLEPVEIFTDNSAASKQKNIDNLNAYKSNLAELGVDISKSFQVPFREGQYATTIGTLHYSEDSESYVGAGYYSDEDTALVIRITSTGEFLNLSLATKSDAIKYSYTPVPLTATTSTNKTQLDLFLSKVPTVQVMHVTYKDMYAGTLHKINGSWYGVLVGESNTLAGQLSIKLQADGTIVEGTA